MPCHHAHLMVSMLYGIISSLSHDKVVYVITPMHIIMLHARHNAHLMSRGGVPNLWPVCCMSSQTMLVNVLPVQWPVWLYKYVTDKLQRFVTIHENHYTKVPVLCF